MRRLWPKYDTDLNQYVETMETVLALMEHTFKEAKLEGDHEEFSQQQENSIEELVYRA
jgi:hypothetical protein